MGGEERMARFPPLVAEDITLDEGLGESEAVADIKFSSAGNFTPSTFLFFNLATPRSMWDLSSLTRD